MSARALNSQFILAGEYGNRIILRIDHISHVEHAGYDAPFDATSCFVTMHGGGRLRVDATFEEVMVAIMGASPVTP